MLSISPIRAFNDNYIWCLSNGTNAWVVDPGDAAPVLTFLDKNELSLKGVLVTHHHADHTGGIEALVAAMPELTVFAPRGTRYSGPATLVNDGQILELSGLDQRALVCFCPGHTLDHCAYQVGNHLFCGDTLFSGGCGRLFEGSPSQMHDSLAKLRDLGASNLLYPTHEYTLANLEFALAVEPQNQQLHAYQQKCRKLRNDDIATLPTTMAQELAINPFLRTHLPELQQSAAAHSGAPCTDSLECFTQLRAWKDNF
ncbi:hydroxyacylglutathione hydrolase [Ferrimonas aestuarii]|uniref:Hydroxyacylglutathione hydrolase n=1 Tax=Ferrimonas aestuarii TaxID=2569539 RepID=A0A4U1BKG8_9GAMM|nr:hydroxyacylglutathione hydrolase [Ferrimonas aestuarii]TKB51706.1 hydroxyacylglutathione hydrolase [Ferrimonas aestuarii]